MLTQEQINAIRSKAGAGPLETAGTPSLLSKLGIEEEVQEPSMIESGLDYMKDWGKEAWGGLKEEIGEVAKPELFEKETSLAEKAGIAGTMPLRAAGAGARAVGGAIAKPFGDIIGAISNKISDLPAVQRFATSETGEGILEGVQNLGQSVGERLEMLKETIGEENYQSLKDVAEIALLAVGAKPAKEAGMAGLKTAQEGIEAGARGAGALATKGGELADDLYRTLTTKSEQQIENAIVKKFEKGVKPTIAGKSTTGALSDYRDDIVSAVKTIKDNKNNLQFVDDAGDVIAGRTPQSLQELTDALDQTKKIIFSQYDELAKQTGKAGITIDPTPIADELTTVINNKALRLTNPKAIQYAEQLQERLKVTGRIDPETTQDIIKNYNKSLEAFYRNPTYDNASQAAIDAMVVNKFRGTLDDSISGLTGKEYQSLKNQYASLKAIEKDVVKASIRDAKKNVKGLIDFSDILSGGQIVSGILSLNPAAIVQGTTMKFISQFYKYLNNPNRAIRKMFGDVEKLDIKPQSNIPGRQGGFINPSKIADDLGGKKTNPTIDIKKLEIPDFNNGVEVDGWWDIYRKSNAKTRDKMDKDINYLLKDKNNELEPILIKKDGGFLDVEDGHHRVASYLSAGREKIPFKIVESRTALPIDSSTWLKDWIYREPEEVFKHKLTPELRQEFSKYKPKKPVKLYRGVTSDETGKTEFSSWSYSKDVAKEHTYGEGKVISKMVDPDDIILDTTEMPYNLRQKIGIIEEEEEVLVRNLK